MGKFNDLNEISIHFSHTEGIPLITTEGKKLGKLKDFFVDYEEVYPAVLAIQYKSNNQLFYVEWEYVKNFTLKEVIIEHDCFIGRSRSFPKAKTNKVITSLLANQFSGSTMEFPPLGKIILDRQVVDTSGKKVVRVNDIQFIRSGQNLRVTHAAIGMRSMMRRLGYEKFIDFVVKAINPKSLYLKNEVLINWKFVHAVPNKNVRSNVRLTLSDDEIKKLHPADLADILEDLDSYGRELIFSNLDPKLAAETLQEVEDEVKISLIKNEKPEVIAKIIEEMDVDDAADTLNELSDTKAEQIISKIEDTETADEIRELREYQETTAGGLMSKEYFEVAPESDKKSILEKFKKEHDYIENIIDIFVTGESGELVGICPIQNLLLCDDNVLVKNIMISEDIKSTEPETHWKIVASMMSKYNLMNIPVIGEDKTMLGIISVDDLLPWLLDEK